MTANLPAIVDSLDAYPQASPILWESEQFFPRSEEYFQSILLAIGAAKQRIIIATYIFDYDAIGKQFVQKLIEARQRGLDVRVLFDGVGSLDSGALVVKALAIADIPVKIYHPLPWQRDNYKHALRRGTWIGNLIAAALRLNQRHHAKICIVDCKDLWSGSQNISSKHVDSPSGRKGWHDYGVRVAGAAVTKVAAMFDNFWDYRKPHVGHGLFDHYWDNLTAFTRQHKNQLLADKIRAAKCLVWIINPYFSPTRSILRALRDAAMRGVDVRLIVPNQSDIGFFPLLTSTYYDELIIRSVRIFEYLPAILHAKLLLIDDFRLVGSTNFNHRSLLHDLEFDVVLGSDAVLAQTKQCFLDDQAQCREVTRDDLTFFGWRRLLGWLPWLVRYWL